MAEQTARNERIMRMAASGTRPVDIADALGLTRNAVIGVLHRHRTRVWSLTGPAGIAGADGGGWRPRTCQWIEAEPALADSPRCGRPVRHGSSYCAAHHVRCWRDAAATEDMA